MTIYNQIKTTFLAVKLENINTQSRLVNITIQWILEKIKTLLIIGCPDFCSPNDHHSRQFLIIKNTKKKKYVYQGILNLNTETSYS